MYDAIRAATIPSWAQMVAGYCDTIRIPQWTDAEWRLFETVPRVRIAKKASTNDGHVLDVEVGDAKPEEAPGWVRMRRNSGMNPSVYCNLATWPRVRSAFYNSNVDEPWYWIAKYDGDPNWPTGWEAAGVVAKQWKNTADWDISSVADYWPGVDKMPTTSGKEIEMVQGYKTATQRNMVIPCNGATQLFVEVPGRATGETVDAHAYFVRDTPSGTTDASYAGDRTLHFDADRPGPVSVPAGTRAVSLYYVASADFGAWCA
jgi:hypothetical protein